MDRSPIPRCQDDSRQSSAFAFRIGIASEHQKVYLFETRAEGSAGFSGAHFQVPVFPVPICHKAAFDEKCLPGGGAVVERVHPLARILQPPTVRRWHVRSTRKSE
jgi:hypothetical protein